MRPGRADEILRLAGLDFTLADRRLRILDLGTGVGYFPHLCRRLGHEATGVDYAAARIDEARRLYPGGDYVFADAYEYVANAVETGQRFDLVTAWDVLEHLEQPAQLVAAARLIADQVTAAVPIDHQADTHLQYYEHAAAIRAALEPDTLTEYGYVEACAMFRVALCNWAGF